MKRRDFGQVLAGGSIGAVAAGCEKSGAVVENVTPQPRKKALMHVGTQHFSSPTEEDLQYLVRHGVNHCCGRVRKLSSEGVWDIKEMKRMKDIYDKHGVILENLFLGMSSSGIDTHGQPNIMLGKSPGRDREIEVIIGNIEKTAEIGVSTLQYSFTILPILRSGLTPGRGGSSYNTWILDEAQDTSMTIAGKVSIDDFFERIAYFLERVIPVAEEYKVRMAVHTPDPPTPPGYRGITRWDTNVFEGFKRYVETYESPYNGLLLCVGSSGEGLVNPNEGICDIVRYFGERKKIFLIHLRNIRGGRNNFQEVYPDEGDMDFYQVVRTLRDVEYPYMIMPDHMPTHPDDPGGRGGLQSFAFGYGYIKGLIQAVNSEV